MIAQTVSVSDNFRAQALKAILSIVVFVVVFLLLIAFAVWLMIKCVTWAFAFVLASPGLITLLLGVGLASLGFLVLFFLIKFLFKTHKVDRSHLVEIKREDEPAIFALIDEIVTEVGTTFPKRVYLSADVNAAVFYDSSFWSMFLPIKKNLQIGLGLVNTVTAEEFKGILAHEFGHFSQRSMKVGSYVYNVNQIIHNMLYDNEGYDKIIQNWASVTWYFAIFVMVAIKIVQAIQWILGKLYNLINLSYLSLSREMEFHADEIAAYSTGSSPLGQSLLRMDIAQQAFNVVIQFYQNAVKSGTLSTNLYPEQQYALHFLAKENQIPIVDGLPQPESEDLHQFIKSKLIIDNQWASHPSTSDRVAALQRLGVPVPKPMPELANQLFSQLSKYQEQLTRLLFPLPQQGEQATILDLDNFVPQFEAHLASNRFHPTYKGYFDQRNPVVMDLDETAASPLPQLSVLLAEDKVELANEQAILEYDLDILNRIASGEAGIKTFDYDGRKYLLRECRALIVKLNKRNTELQDALAENDRLLYQHFYQLAEKRGEETTLRKYYQSYYDFDKGLDKELKIYQTTFDRLQLISELTTIDEVHSFFSNLKTYERELKEKITLRLESNFYQEVLTPTTREHLEKYLSKDWRYFGQEQYFEDSLNVLFYALECYKLSTYRAHFQYRKRLLDFQASLVDGVETSN
ncbi:MAG: M48 family metallopeptidase [Bacteroidota bacterium]